MSESPRRPGLDQEEDRINATGAAILTTFGVFMVAIAMWAGVQKVESIGGREVTPSTAQETPPRTEEVRPVRAIGAINVTDILADSSTRADRDLRKKRLDAYGWADRDRGVVTIPIERAMQLVAERARGATGGSGSPDDSAHQAPGAPGPAQEAP